MVSDKSIRFILNEKLHAFVYLEFGVFNVVWFQWRFRSTSRCCGSRKRLGSFLLDSVNRPNRREFLSILKTKLRLRRLNRLAVRLKQFTLYPLNFLDASADEERS